MVQQRSIAVAIILSIVTCGIYSLYWIYVMDTDTKLMANEEGGMSSGLVVLLGIVTCGIYYMYWSYVIGKRMYTAKQNVGMAADDNSILYLVLSIFGFSIITMALCQNDVNNMVTRN